MTPQEITHKLASIARLPAGEVIGWWEYIHRPDTARKPFDGEIAALINRAREVGVELKRKHHV